jgi:hypothetical protein
MDVSKGINIASWSAEVNVEDCVRIKVVFCPSFGGSNVNIQFKFQGKARLSLLSEKYIYKKS